MNLLGKGECPKKLVKTFDHPTANGRQPQKGDVVYSQTFTLDDGSLLIVEMGQKGFDTCSQLMMDMLTGRPGYDDGSLRK